LAYCAERNGNFDIYTIPVDGGEEKRLTISDGLDDGPDYSSDGKYILILTELDICRYGECNRMGLIRSNDF
jgi:hypothetical protein